MKFIVTLSVIVAVSFATRYFLRKSRAQLTANEFGVKVLRFSQLYEFIGWSGLLMSSFFIFFVVKEYPVKFNFIMFSFGIIFLISGFFLILARRNISVFFDDEKIEYFGIFRNKKALL